MQWDQGEVKAPHIHCRLPTTSPATQPACTLPEQTPHTNFLFFRSHFLQQYTLWSSWGTSISSRTCSQVGSSWYTWAHQDYVWPHVGEETQGLTPTCRGRITTANSWDSGWNWDQHHLDSRNKSGLKTVQISESEISHLVSIFMCTEPLRTDLG